MRKASERKLGKLAKTSNSAHSLTSKVDQKVFDSKEKISNEQYQKWEENVRKRAEREKKRKKTELDKQVDAAYLIEDKRKKQ